MDNVVDIKDIARETVEHGCDEDTMSHCFSILLFTTYDQFEEEITYDKDC
jgi:hypothetical protein